MLVWPGRVRRSGVSRPARHVVAVTPGSSTDRAIGFYPIGCGFDSCPGDGRFTPVAQWIEPPGPNGRVPGSIPGRGTQDHAPLAEWFSTRLLSGGRRFDTGAAYGVARSPRTVPRSSMGVREGAPVVLVGLITRSRSVRLRLPPLGPRDTHTHL